MPSTGSARPGNPSPPGLRRDESTGFEVLAVGGGSILKFCDLALIMSWDKLGTADRGGEAFNTHEI